MVSRCFYNPRQAFSNQFILNDSSEVMLLKVRICTDAMLRVFSIFANNMCFQCAHIKIISTAYLLMELAQDSLRKCDIITHFL